MSTVALPARPTGVAERPGRYEFIPSGFKGKSGALFLRVRFRPERAVAGMTKTTGFTNKKTEGMGTR